MVCHDRHVPEKCWTKDLLQNVNRLSVKSLKNGKSFQLTLPNEKVFIDQSVLDIFDPLRRFWRGTTPQFYAKRFHHSKNRGISAGVIDSIGVDHNISDLSQRTNDRMEAEEAYRLANEPKQLYYVEGKHNEWMFDDDPKFQALADFYKEYLIPTKFGLQ